MKLKFIHVLIAIFILNTGYAQKTQRKQTNATKYR